ncbi:hypothetical protein AC1031_007991 [Aphanomyces cochlioides]|nr:hypothetical protein AC1031_007991 [Aphanomyces cochlioides]
MFSHRDPKPPTLANPPPPCHRFKGYAAEVNNVPAKYAAIYQDLFTKMDFYQYACGGWLQTTELPVNKLNDTIILEILASQPPVIDSFYQSCVHESNLNDAAMATAKAQLDHIASLSSLDELMV